MLTLTSPVETWLHRVPAGVKLALLCAVTIGLFWISNLLVLAGIILGTALLYMSFGWLFLGHGVRMLRPLLPFIAVVLIWHFFTHDMAGGTRIVLRLVTAVAIANLVTMTTRLTDMVTVIEKIIPALPVLGLNPKAVAMSIALAVRFIPVLGQKLELIRLAWRARSPRRAGWRILIPTVLAVLDDADHVADALRARGGIQ